MASWTDPNEFVLNIDVTQDWGSGEIDALVQRLYKEFTVDRTIVDLSDNHVNDRLVFHFEKLPARFAKFDGLRQGTITLYFTSRYSDAAIRSALSTLLAKVTAQLERSVHGNVGMTYLTQRLLR